MAVHKANRFVAVQAGALPVAKMKAYWEAIIEARLLQSRINDVVNPDMASVIEMHRDKSHMCFYMVDQENDHIAAETMLNHFKGLCAQVHFSVHPNYFGDIAIQIGREGAEQHLSVQHQQTGRCLETLIGMTPKNNALAIRFVRKVGFKKLDIIPNMFYNSLTKSYTDCFVSKLTIEDLY